ncbi:MAG TPA: 2-oxo acid dehydrogenase subunit E2 [Tepidisphaeraceae bacterium]|jgi:2-oxoglutarate dehydrogenase E2 component (dihydrolipoamide succinyltransferase)|nr:2-oxo acid dehydrogenase subunit E2 [Tepidisphaeraceae bacterium]
MAEPTPIHVPRENVNDESVKLVAWLVSDGQPVAEKQAVAEIETSKATAEVYAPAAGKLTHRRRAGEEIEIGGLLGYVGEGALPAAAADSPPPAIATPAVARPEMSAVAEAGHVLPAALADLAQLDHATPPAHSTRFSAKAAELIAQRGIDPARFASRGLVRAQDVRQFLGESPANGSAVAPAKSASVKVDPETPVAAAGVAVRAEALPRSKRVEARYLAGSLSRTLPSVVTVACPTRGLRRAAGANPLLNGQIAPLVLFETARLLRKYPLFNGYHHDGQIHFYERVNIGFAMDADRGLKVPVIRNADEKSIAQMVGELREFLVQYLDDKLPIESLAGGTFTVTDLSGEGVFTFHPLINQGQSAILGIGGEFFAPGGGEGMFNLILAFDHQVAEGRLAAKFLNELKHRLSAYEQALADVRIGPSRQEPCCSQCLTPIGELLQFEHRLLQTIGPDGQLQPICSRCLLGFS